MGETALSRLDDELRGEIEELELGEAEKEQVAAIAGCDLVTLHTSDVDGKSLGLPMPGRQFPSSVKNGAGIDGSSVKGFGRGVEESDMWMAPDLGTGIVLPWKNSMDRSMARVVTDLRNADGTSFEGDARSILRRQLKRAADMGFDFTVSPELEFFVFPTDDEGKPIAVSRGNTSYYRHLPGHLADVRTEMMIRLGECGLNIEAAHPEVADNQHEINFKCGSALEQADKVVLFRDVVKDLAKMFGHHATFMDKPIAGVNGSGMHTNMSLTSLDGGENLFYDEEAEDKLSLRAKQFIAGIMAHIDGITAIANPTVNSYRRLVPGFEAPVYKSWGYSNRSSLIRVPKVKNPKATRAELRSPGPMCNPHLAFAVMLAAGLDGMENEMEAPEPRKEDLFKLSPQELAEINVGHLPTSLRNAIGFLEKDDLLRKALGDHTHQSFLRSKRAEWLAYKQQVPKEEFERYALDF